MITTKDLVSSNVMMTHQKTISRRNSLLIKAPHIGSKTVITIGRCAGEYDYEDPIYVKPYDDRQEKTRELVKEWAIYTKWEFLPEACDNTISCNPYFPKNSTCRGLPTDKSVDTMETREFTGIDEPFSFKDGITGQRFNVCQPICYEQSSTDDNLIGLYTRFSFDSTIRSGNITHGKCYVSDPLLLAFYLDPARRVVDENKELVEDSGLYTTTRLLGNPPQPTLVAKIPTNYCRQYGLDRIEDPVRVNGETLYMCKQDESVLSLSNLTGNIISRAIHIGFKEALDKIRPKPITDDERLEPTEAYLKNRDTWAASVIGKKRPLPFPLKLSDLGIVLGTATEWLIWTDAYPELSDNDIYGGRLIERDRPILFNIIDNSKFKREYDVSSLKLDFNSFEPQINATTDDNTDITAEVRVLKSVRNAIERYRTSVENAGLGSLFTNQEVMSGMINQLSTQGILDWYSTYTAESVKLKRMLNESLTVGSRIQADTLGYVLANSTLVTNVERGLLKRLTAPLKRLFRLPKTTAGLLQLVNFIGFAVDLFGAFIYDPLNRYQRYFSDKTLLYLARAELEWNTRYLGTNRIIVKPYEWIINTPYYDIDEEIKTTLTILPSIIQARSVNSDGSLIRRDAYNYVSREDGAHDVTFNSNGKSTLNPDNVLDAITTDLPSVCSKLSAHSTVRSNNNNNNSGGIISSIIHNGIFYYILIVFIVICVAAAVSHSIEVVKGKTGRRTIYIHSKLLFPVAILFSVISIGLPLGAVSSVKNI